MKMSEVEELAGSKFVKTGGLSDLVRQVRGWENGARGIVGGFLPKGEGTGHYFNVVNNGGNVTFLDAQRGWADLVATWDEYYLMRTN